MARMMETEQAAAARIARQLGGLWGGGRTGRTGRRTYAGTVKAVGRKQGGVRHLINGLDYAGRGEGWEHRSDELELEGGRSRAEMRGVIEAADEATTRKNGTYALTGILELPMTAGMNPDASKAMRESIAEGLEHWFESRGLPCHWAIHSHNDKGQFQPHLHFTTTRRPVRQVDGQWIAEAGGARGRPGVSAILQTRDELKTWRGEVAEIVNEAAAAHGLRLVGGEWDGGSFRDIDHERAGAAQGRVPMAVLKAQDADKRPETKAREAAVYTPAGADTIRAEREAWGFKRRREDLRLHRERRREKDRARRERIERAGGVDAQKADGLRVEALADQREKLAAAMTARQTAFAVDILVAAGFDPEKAAAAVASDPDAAKALIGAKMRNQAERLAQVVGELKAERAKPRARSGRGRERD